MDYEIYPLAITQVEWSIFIDVCQRALGSSPTRGIDGCHLDIKDPAAYLGSLDMENHPLGLLRNGASTWLRHFSITFIMLLDEEAICLLGQTELKVSWKEAKQRRSIAIVTADMSIWRQTILEQCRADTQWILRWIMNRVLARFEQAGFRELFSDHKKIDLSDETFCLD